jgi:hypothetical protein
MSVEYRASFTYSVALARRVYLRRLWELRNGFIVTTPIFAFLAIRTLAIGEDSPLAWFALGVITALWSAWWLGWVHIGRAAAAVGTPEVTFVATAETCTFRTTEAESVVRWSGIARLYRYPQVWLFVRKGLIQMSFVPSALLTPEAKAFVEERVTSSGGRLA